VGRLLASQLQGYAAKSDVVVVALPRGGVPVAFEIARRIDASLDILIVRKLAVPWQPELAMGAVASGGVRLLDQALIRSLNLPNSHVYGLIAGEEKEIQRRETLFRRGCPAQTLSGRTVILVDDGAATSSTILAAAEAILQQHPKQIVIAVPVASRDACLTFQARVGKRVCLATPEPFFAVGQWGTSRSPKCQMKKSRAFSPERVVSRHGEGISRSVFLIGLTIFGRISHGPMKPKIETVRCVLSNTPSSTASKLSTSPDDSYRLCGGRNRSIGNLAISTSKSHAAIPARPRGERRHRIQSIGYRNL